jgi:hypothetical protein
VRIPLPWKHVLGLLGVAGSWGIGVPIAIAQAPNAETAPDSAPYLRPQAACPEELETLITGLLRDLPSYANRVARRLGTNEGIAGFGTILVAGRAEFEPLNLADLTFGSRAEDANAEGSEALQQVFFTTLERQYTATEQIQLEEYHWLFLTPAEDGWRLAFMFSRLAVQGSIVRPPTPPRESSDGIIGQGVRLWLRDCRAGAVYPVEP